GFEPEIFQTSDIDIAKEALWEITPASRTVRASGTLSTTDVPPMLRGITIDRLLAEGPLRLNIPERFTPFAEGRFPTPSGKCELYCERMIADGFDPLPAYTPPAESRDSNPDLAARFPLQLISPPSPHFLNSTFVNVNSLRHAALHPELEIHPVDAGVRGI